MTSRAASRVVTLASALLLALPAAVVGAAGDLTEYPLPSAGSDPVDIIAGGDGNLWVSETKGHAIARLTPGGELDEFRLSTDFTAPDRLAIAQDGNVWFGDHRTQPNRVGRIDSLRSITFFPVPTKSATVAGLEAAPNGNLWITESSPTKIAQLAPGGSGANPPAVTES